MIFPKKINIGDNVYQCPKCGGFLELEEEEKIVIFDSSIYKDEKSLYCALWKIMYNIDFAKRLNNTKQNLINFVK